MRGVNNIPIPQQKILFGRIWTLHPSHLCYYLLLIVVLNNIVCFSYVILFCKFKEFFYSSTLRINVTSFAHCSYNKNSSCEELEMLRKRYQERWVGAETSCLVVQTEDSLNALKKLTASAKKRARRNGWAVSPGRRLSYLARRRNTFNNHAIHRALVIDKYVIK